MRIWRIAVPVLALLIFGLSFRIEVLAESNSSSYKAEDFVNPESSLSSSSSYQLHDSVDYYGGVDVSANYQQCTGDYAVLEGCGNYVPPVIPPVTPPVVGAGGPYPTHDDCNQVNCLNEPPTPTEPTQPENPPINPPFELPNIDEPTGPGVPISPEHPSKPVVPVAPVKSNPGNPAIVKSNNGNPLNPGQIDQINKGVTAVENAVIHAVAGEALCSDKQCTDIGLRGAAQKTALAPAVCSIYTFGGFAIDWECQDSLMVWLVIGLMSLFVLPITLLRKKLFSEHY